MTVHVNNLRLHREPTVWITAKIKDTITHDRRKIQIVQNSSTRCCDMMIQPGKVSNAFDDVWEFLKKLMANFQKTSSTKNSKDSFKWCDHIHIQVSTGMCSDLKQGSTPSLYLGVYLSVRPRSPAPRLSERLIRQYPFLKHFANIKSVKNS